MSDFEVEPYCASAFIVVDARGVPLRDSNCKPRIFRNEADADRAAALASRGGSMPETARRLLEARGAETVEGYSGEYFIVLDQMPIGWQMLLKRFGLVAERRDTSEWAIVDE